MNLDIIAELCDKNGSIYSYNEKMSDYSTFRIGGPCDILVKPNSADSAAEIINACRREKIPYYIFGKGSNILVSAKGLKGVVIILSSEYSDIKVEGDTLICQSGASLRKIAALARDNSLTGMEFAHGIPGTVGGALCMNAGAYGGEMKDIVVSADYLDENGNIVGIGHDDMMLSYRDSIFLKKDYIVLSVVIRLKKGNAEEISKKMNELMDKRRKSQPLEYASAGSTFKRPEGDFAARLIDAGGLKGFSCGDAEVSTKHSGFVVNKGNATFNDVMTVIDGVKKKVYEDSGVMLECEVRIFE